MQTENSLNPYGRIYRLTDTTNGKMYHGQTTEEDINKRWNKYKRLQCKRQPKLYNALKAHGPENFLFEVIDTTPQDQTQLDNMEIFYIAKFDSMSNGYNCNPGGFGGKHSDETKRKISEGNIGKHAGYKNHMFGKTHSPETILKMSEAHKGEKNEMFNKCHSEEAKARISDSLKGDNNPNFGKPVSEEIKKKISKAKMGKGGRVGSDNHMFGRCGDKNPNFGKIGELSPLYRKPRSEETKRKISESLKARRHID